MHSPFVVRLVASGLVASAAVQGALEPGLRARAVVGALALAAAPALAAPVDSQPQPLSGVFEVPGPDNSNDGGYDHNKKRWGFEEDGARFGSPDYIRSNPNRNSNNAPGAPADNSPPSPVGGVVHQKRWGFDEDGVHFGSPVSSPPVSGHGGDEA